MKSCPEVGSFLGDCNFQPFDGYFCPFFGIGETGELGLEVGGHEGMVS